MINEEVAATRRALFDEIVANGSARIGFEHGELCRRVIAGWNCFLELPPKIRSQWRVGDPKDWDDGYVFRDGEGTAGGGAYDKKHFFHYRPHLYTLLRYSGVDFEKQIQWLEFCHQLWHFCFETAVDVAKVLQLGNENCFVGMMHRPVPRSTHVLRLLSYNEPMKPEQLLGKFHVDRCFLTIHVYENYAGLQITHPETKVNSLYKQKESQALVFTGLKAHNIEVDRGDKTKVLRGVPHGIVVPNDFVPNPLGQDSRQSIVFFSHI